MGIKWKTVYRNRFLKAFLFLAIVWCAALFSDRLVQLFYYWLNEKLLRVSTLLDLFLVAPRPTLLTLVISAFLGLLLTVWLCITAGRKPEDEELHLQWLDRVYGDFLLCALGFLFVGYFRLLYFFCRELYPSTGESSYSACLFGIAASTALFVAILLGCLLSFARRIKANMLFRQTFLFILCSRLIEFFSGLFDGRNYPKKSLARQFASRQLAFIVAEIVLILLATIFLSLSSIALMLGCLILGAAVMFWYIRGTHLLCSQLQDVLRQLDEIADGQLQSTASLPPNSPLLPASERLSHIGGGLQKSLEKQIRDERMKIDLVTNVSHDLKTPLTSIISYVDLLSHTKDLPPEATDYITILSKKSYRLKNIVSDLFDLARATSGNAEIHIERLDLKRLIEQTLADMDDRVSSASQSLRISFPPEPVVIEGDGKKLYRVFQNVFDNALKYSLPNTRIFITLTEQNGRAWAMVSNTASYEMNFTKEEVLERFSRGDKSRTTEGSGLGLSIADSFTNACGGHFEIMIDGDQFKTAISFPLAPELPPAQDTEQR